MNKKIDELIFVEAINKTSSKQWELRRQKTPVMISTLDKSDFKLCLEHPDTFNNIYRSGNVHAPSTFGNYQKLYDQNCIDDQAFWLSVLKCEYQNIQEIQVLTLEKFNDIPYFNGDIEKQLTIFEIENNQLQITTNLFDDYLNVDGEYFYKTSDLPVLTPIEGRINGRTTFKKSVDRFTPYTFAIDQLDHAKIYAKVTANERCDFSSIDDIDTIQTDYTTISANCYQYYGDNFDATISRLKNVYGVLALRINRNYSEIERLTAKYPSQYASLLLMARLAQINPFDHTPLKDESMRLLNSLHQLDKINLNTDHFKKDPDFHIN